MDMETTFFSLNSGFRRVKYNRFGTGSRGVLEGEWRRPFWRPRKAEGYEGPGGGKLVKQANGQNMTDRTWAVSVQRLTSHERLFFKPSRLQRQATRAQALFCLKERYPVNYWPPGRARMARMART